MFARKLYTDTRRYHKSCRGRSLGSQGDLPGLLPVAPNLVRYSLQVGLKRFVKKIENHMRCALNNTGAYYALILSQIPVIVNT